LKDETHEAFFEAKALYTCTRVSGSVNEIISRKLQQVSQKGNNDLVSDKNRQ
jgi:hypothetical protein